MGARASKLQERGDSPQDFLPLMYLPDEMILYIFSFLPFIDLLAVRKTCRRLYDIASDRRLRTPRPEVRVRARLVNDKSSSNGMMCGICGTDVKQPASAAARTKSSKKTKTPAMIQWLEASQAVKCLTKGISFSSLELESLTLETEEDVWILVRLCAVSVTVTSIDTYFAKRSLKERFVTCLMELSLDGALPISSFTFRLSSLQNAAQQDFTYGLRYIPDVDLLGVQDSSQWPSFPAFRLQFFAPGPVLTQRLKVPLTYFDEYLPCNAIFETIGQIENVVFLHYDPRSSLRVRQTLREFTIDFKRAELEGTLRLEVVRFIDLAWGRHWQKDIVSFMELYSGPDLEPYISPRW